MKTRFHILAILTAICFLFSVNYIFALNKSSGLKGKLNINTATAKEFSLLPGIGKEKAKRITDLRSRIKGFKRTDDLLKVKGFGKKLFAKVKPFIKLEGKSDLLAEKKIKKKSSK